MFRERIQAHYDQLTTSFRKLADFILQEPLNASFMTATQMADQMNVDAATVVRFAQFLGYSGYRELIKDIQTGVKEELSASYTDALDAPDDLGLFRGLLENERKNLAQTQAQMTTQANRILPLIKDANRIWTIGQNTCQHLAALCATTLRELGLQAISITPDSVTVSTHLKTLGENDLIIGFSLTEMDLDVANTVHFARDRGASTLVFASSPVSETALAADVQINCPGSSPTHPASFTSHATMIVVLAAAFRARYPEQAEQMDVQARQSYRQLLDLKMETTSNIDVEEL